MANSSSIFNFEALRAAARLPLRVHLWHALLASGAIAVFAAASSQLHYEPRPGRTPADLSALAGRLASAEVALLGNSQMDEISGERFIYPSVSLALGGTGYRCQNALLREFAPRMPKLRVVLLGFDNIPLRVTDIEERVGDFADLEAFGLPWYRVPARWRDRLRYAIRYSPWCRDVFLGHRPGIEQLGRWPFWPKAEAAATDTSAAAESRPSVFGLTPGYGNPRVGGAGKIGSYMNRYRDEKIRRLGQEAFFDLLSYCDTHQIAPVLVRLPTTPAFYGARNSAWDTELVALLEDARRRFPRLTLPVWDAEGSLDIPVEDFLDPNHLGPEGARKTANFFNARLLETPYRDDSPSLFASKRRSLLATPDPREDGWLGIEKSDETVALVPAPQALAGIATRAFRITLRRGESFYGANWNPIRAGSTVDAAIWLWAASAMNPDFYLVLGPGDENFQTASSAHILALADHPQEFKLSYTFAFGESTPRFQFTNLSNRDLTFFMAAPSVRLRPNR
jgi:hypothetical protein